MLTEESAEEGRERITPATMTDPEAQRIAMAALKLLAAEEAVDVHEGATDQAWVNFQSATVNATRLQHHQEWIRLTGEAKDVQKRRSDAFEALAHAACRTGRWQDQ